jgi:sulfoxide reductase heme-binding subunit YedZ
MTQSQLVRRVLKPAVFVAALLPFLYLLWRAAMGELSANPIEDITLTTGRWTLRFLMITLAVTPLRRVTGWQPAVRFRRMLGTLHLLTYVVLDQFFAWHYILQDIAKRPYITVGFAAFVLMVPLALTSTSGMIRRLGGRRWALLHRLIYVSALGGVVHFWWKVKADTRDPLVYALILAVLLAARVWFVARKAAARRAAPGAVAARAANG